MKVSERAKKMREVLEDVNLKAIDRVIIALSQLVQLEVDIVEALQIARQEGYSAGWNERSMVDDAR